MKTLFYDELQKSKIKGLSKLVEAIENNNFTQADIKKVGDNLFRAKLNHKDRILLCFHKYQNENFCLFLEYLPNHNYDKSRFLHGAVIDTDSIPSVTEIESVDASELVYLNPNSNHFHILDKVLSFDDVQQQIYQAPSPLVIIGSAGSGKTALLLERMKQGVGDVLYVSHSTYLVQNSHQLYYSNGYDNDLQEQVDFLSFQEYLESIKVPQGKVLTRKQFEQWFQQNGKTKFKEITAHKLFEEIRGALSGVSVDCSYLSRSAYSELGVKQSLFAMPLRGVVYDLFEKYISYLAHDDLYDDNIVSYEYLNLVLPRYDMVVIDEVQDITNVQLLLILKSLKANGEFILCGDSNQIVHSNFFSWSNLKSLFFGSKTLNSNHQALHILHANYRNSPLVTNVANRILKLKHARFGSVDKESNYLVESVGSQTGKLQLLEFKQDILSQLDSGSSQSTKFAIIVMHAEQKPLVSKYFSTPLVFSIQEAKGLEYDNIVLFNFVNTEEKIFHEITRNVDVSQLDIESLKFSRAKDKQDKSLEIYKFYINSLYVAVTRAVTNLYVIEQDLTHPLIELLDLNRFAGELSVETHKSSKEDWQIEARRLEQQGKLEQAEAIKDKILQQKQVPWVPLNTDGAIELKQKALSGDKKSKIMMMEYAILHHDLRSLMELSDNGVKAAKQFLMNPSAEHKAFKAVYKNRFMIYDLKNPNGVLREVEKYGIEHRTIFNLTPLMQSVLIGNVSAVEHLSRLGSDRNQVSNTGLNSWQFALGSALSGKLTKSAIGKMYEHIAPDSISILVDGKLEKLDEKKMYGFLFNALFSLWYHRAGTMLAHGEMFTAQNLAEMFDNLPDFILPAMKKKRNYISRYLSENEVERDTDRNKKLFIRIKRGHYLLNPKLKVRIGEDWLSILELLSFDKIGYLPWRYIYEHEPQLKEVAQRNDRIGEENIKRTQQLLMNYQTTDI